MKIGMIGLGIMGKPMAKNLLKSGYDLVVADRNFAPVQELCKAGAEMAKNLSVITAECDVILTMLPNSPNVKQVVLEDGGLIETIREGTVFIDMSSINPIASQEIAKKLAAKGVEMLDAPVSGGEPKAIDGTLAFMVGGKKEVFNAHKKLLLSMGVTCVYCGETGAGNVTKLCNQIVVSANIAAVSEALLLGKMAGVSPELIYQAIRGGLAGSTVLDAKAPMMMDRNFAPGFKIDLHMKDMANVLDTAKELNAPMFLSSITMEMMKALHVSGDGQYDHAAIVKFYERIAGIEISPLYSA